MNNLSVRLPEELDQRLGLLADKTGRTKTYYVREAIMEHIDQLEDTYLALNRLEKPSKRWILSELENGVDLES